MQTDSSASLTCMASASAVEWTATVAMPSSFAARRMRKAISPRFAMRILSNMSLPSAADLFDHDQRLAEFDGLGVFDEDRHDDTSARRDDFVEGLHGFDQEQRFARLDLSALLDKPRRLRRGAKIGGAHHG